jgi:hypothetical protein
VNDDWRNLFFGTIESRPVKTDIRHDGIIKVITTPLDELAPDRIAPDQEMIAMELEAETGDELARGVRACGFCDAAIREILRKVPT